MFLIMFSCDNFCEMDEKFMLKSFFFIVIFDESKLNSIFSKFSEFKLFLKIWGNFNIIS